MIKRVANGTLYVKDQNESLRFYTEVLGFEVRADMTLGDFRWLTVSPKDQPEFEIALYQLRADGYFLSEDDVKVMTRLMEESKIGGFVLKADDVQKTYEELKAKGVEFTKPPTQEPYGMEAVFKDINGHFFSLGQA
jgi:catechol 2,3-dioxygenase-like lactoylglutathione lyase family enzyme